MKLWNVLNTDRRIHDSVVFRTRPAWKKIQGAGLYSVWKGFLLVWYSVSKNERLTLYNLSKKYNVLWSRKLGYMSRDIGWLERTKIRNALIDI